VQRRAYGRLGKTVSEIGFGAWQLGNGRDWGQQTTEADAIALVHAALNEGVNLFDTAPGYGLGHSEEIFGHALTGRRQDVVINTKAGHDADGRSDFSPDGLRTSVEGSLRRLRTDYLDSVLLHNPPEECLRGDSAHMQILKVLRQEGKLLAFGASVDSAQDMRTVIETSEAAVLEVLFNVFHQETADAFALAEEREVALLIKVPLDSGWLSGKYDRDSVFPDIRRRWSPAVLERRFDLLDRIRFLETEEITLAQAAIAFILAHPAVTSVMPGIKSVAQLQENAAAADVRLSEEAMQRLRAVWTDHIAAAPLPW